MRVLFVFGTRPEAIKMSPVIRAMGQEPDSFDVRICVTAQHRDMLDQVLDLFHIRPHYDLNLMKSGQSLADVNSRVLGKLDPVVRQEKPDWLLVQGDTTTAMAAGLVGFYNRAKIGHIEAGLRTKDKFQPFPEEINRRVVGSLADLHFAPTERARQNLVREGVDASSVIVTGNTVIDALLQTAAMSYSIDGSPLCRIPFDKRVLLVTIHRRENFGTPLLNVCKALETIATEYPNDIHVVFPVHPNPNVRGLVTSLLGTVPGVTLLEPLDYLSFVQLLKRAHLVLTDSGGIQEESPSLGKPVLVLREVTERPEALEAGTARTVGTDTRHVVEEVARLLEDEAAYNNMARSVNPYGDGHAAQKICAALRGPSR